MVNKKKWINNYNNLDPENQLLVAEAIAKELRNNEMAFDEHEYDKEKSRIIRKFFNTIRNNIKQSEQLKKYTDIFERYESLSQGNRKKVIDVVN